MIQMRVKLRVPVAISRAGMKGITMMIQKKILPYQLACKT
jgi:hypothetical protein